MNDDEIRSLLRDARVTDPMPASVASRLDDVLAGLRTTDADTEPDLAPVVPLRRRVAPRLLAAAAAVVLVAGVGVGLQQVLQGGEADSAQTDSAATAERAVPEQAPVPAPADSLGKSLDSDSTASTPGRSPADKHLRVAGRALLSRQALVLRELQRKAPLIQVTPLSGLVDDRAYSFRASALACPAPFLAALPGSVSGVVPTSAGRALLVVGPDQGGDVHLVELWGCASSSLVARQTLDLG